MNKSATVPNIPTFSDDSEEGTKGVFRRAFSRKKSSRNPLGEDESLVTPRRYKKSLKQSTSLIGRLSRSRSEKGQEITGLDESLKPNSKYVSSLRSVLSKYPGLSVEPLSAEWAHDMIVFGGNSIKREVIDLNIMLLVMKENEKMLSHTAVERFFQWIPIFEEYLHRYFIVEEEVLIRWVEGRTGKLKGALRQSARMKMKGNIQRKLQTLVAVQDKFHPSLPAGERLPLVDQAIADFTEPVIEYFRIQMEELPGLIKLNFKKTEGWMTRIKLVKFVASRVGAQDFLVLYTRWLSQKELLEWRAKILLSSDFKFRAYKSWEKDMDYAHFVIAREFQEDLDYENADDIHRQMQARKDFERAQIAQRQRAAALEMMEEHPDYDDCSVDMEDEAEEDH